MDTTVVHVSNLHKQYLTPWGRPGVYALKGVSLEIAQGEVYGLIGPNGSGKSTLMKALLGLVQPTEGVCNIFGLKSQDADSRQHVGFLPENPYFYKFLTGRETLTFYGKLCGLSKKILPSRIETTLQLVGLTDAADRRLAGYSKGMLQRIGLAQAFINSPKLVVLDEPTAGVDPVGSRAIRDIILDLKAQNTTVFLCSHLLEQVQEVCDRVGIIFQGTMIAEGSMSELTSDTSKTQITLNHCTPELLANLQQTVQQSGSAQWISAGHPHNSLEQIFLAALSKIAH